jgi:NgoFVII C-terminal B3-like DNA-binding domain
VFFLHQSEINRTQYINFLKIVGGLSNLFSDSDTPYLHYRIGEKIFCKAFKAEDLSRSDISADAKKNGLGIGLKTFRVGNNKTFQKIAEFNSDRPLYIHKKAISLITKIAELRNTRIEFATKIHDLKQSIYHCVVREAGNFKIFEESMDKIDTQNISQIKEHKNSISFNDGLHDYSFLLSKSTLTKRFQTTKILFEFDVEILKDPLFELHELLAKKSEILMSHSRILSTVFLPLYGSNKKVYPKSGLNQWNADGRERHPDEVYIPVPRIIHKTFPNFFPDRDTPFCLEFPDGEKVEAKICQDGGKALMTHSNRKLGKLILRDGLKLKIGELATYEKLQLLGIDSVRIDKISDTLFEINFAKNSSYEDFITNNT